MSERPLTEFERGYDAGRAAGLAQAEVLVQTAATLDRLRGPAAELKRRILELLAHAIGTMRPDALPGAFDPSNTMLIEGYAGQLHANAALTEGRLYIAWPLLREEVRQHWRGLAREYVAAMAAERLRA